MQSREVSLTSHFVVACNAISHENIQYSVSNCFCLLGAGFPLVLSVLIMNNFHEIEITALDII